MSTLFDTYYDTFGNELHIGSPVGFKSKGFFIYGTVIEIVSDKKDGYKFIVVPNIGWSGQNEIENIQKRYKVSHKRLFLINLNRKKMRI